MTNSKKASSNVLLYYCSATVFLKVLLLKCPLLLSRLSKHPVFTCEIQNKWKTIYWTDMSRLLTCMEYSSRMYKAWFKIITLMRKMLHWKRKKNKELPILNMENKPSEMIETVVWILHEKKLKLICKYAVIYIKSRKFIL